MATLDKMSILGIRSFGPRDVNRQELAFLSPMTVILGDNGCGKTTIIECLKYVTTGDMPPNTGRGSAFIHDPKIAKVPEVKAQVKLSFNDCNGRDKVIITRSIVATYKGTNSNMRTLDSTLRRSNMDTGVVSDISSKCLEVNVEMSNSLGVSRAILDSVIFCHQEESNWPLDEGKKVKERFDAIFSATKYIKCMDNLHKLFKEMNTDIGKKEVGLKLHAERKQIFHRTNEELKVKRSRLDSTVKDSEILESKMMPLITKLEELMGLEQNLVGLQREMERKQGMLEHLDEEVEVLQKRLKEDTPTDEAALTRSLRNFDEEIREKEKDIKKLDDQISKGEADQQSLSMKITRMSVDMGKLRNESEQHQKHLGERDQLLRSLKLDDAGLPSSGVLEDDHVRRASAVLEARIESAEMNLAGEKIDFDQEMKCLEEDVIEARCKKAKVEQDLSSKESTIQTLVEEVRKVRERLSEAEGMGSQVEHLEVQKEELENQLRQVQKEMDVNKVKAEVVANQAKKATLEVKEQALKKEVNSLQENAHLQTQIDTLLQECNAKEEAARRILNKNEEVLQKLFTTIPERNLKLEVQMCMEKLNKEISTLQKDLVQKQKSHSTTEIEFKMQREQLKKKEDELRAWQENMYEVCGSDRSESLEEELESLSKKMESSQDQKGILNSSRFFYQKYIEKLKESCPSCPLCHRNFDVKDDAEDLVAELSSKLRDVPEKLQECEKRLEEQQKRYNKLLQMRPEAEKMAKLEMQELQQMRQSLKTSEALVREKNVEVNDLKDKFEAKSSSQKEASSIQGEVSVLEQQQQESRKLKQKIESLEIRLAPSLRNSNHSLQQVRKEHEEVSNQLSTLRESIERRQSQLSEHQEKAQKLRSEVNDVTQEKLRAESLMQEKKQLEVKREELQGQIANLQEEAESCRDALHPLGVALGRAVQEKEQGKEAGDKRIADVQKKMKDLQLKKQEVQALQDLVSSYKKRGGDEKLIELREKLAMLEQNKGEVGREVDGRRKEAGKLKQAVGGAQLHKRELEDSLAVIKKGREIQQLKDKVRDIRERVGEMKPKELLREKSSVIRQIDQIKEQLHETKGRQGELEKTVKEVERELQQDNLKNAEGNYYKAMVYLKTLKMGAVDVKNFRDALEASILKYHEQQMAVINEVLHELWCLVYRGNDIEMIRVACENEDAPKTTTTGKRRAYSYRLVMVKNKTEMDMRGRCSAGQRVLASLLVRIALAEAFSTRCGILALDEPTTNLDKQNVTSLAEALRRLVQRHRLRKTFQLIIITHDKAFVHALSEGQSLDKYYEVSRDSKGCSVIQEAYL